MGRLKAAVSGSSFLRPLQILEAIARSERPIAAIELVRELGVPKATVHRMIAALETAGLARRNPVARQLVIGTRLTALALEPVAKRLMSAEGNASR